MVKNLGFLSISQVLSGPLVVPAAKGAVFLCEFSVTKRDPGVNSLSIFVNLV